MVELECMMDLKREYDNMVETHYSNIKNFNAFLSKNSPKIAELFTDIEPMDYQEYLRTELNYAVDSENYERASAIRDEIERLK